MNPLPTMGFCELTIRYNVRKIWFGHEGARLDCGDLEAGREDHDWIVISEELWER